LKTVPVAVATVWNAGEAIAAATRAETEDGTSGGEPRSGIRLSVYPPCVVFDLLAMTEAVCSDNKK
jgi:hypothetical protein